MSESNKPQGLQVQFETQVTEQDLMNFKLYHNYHSVGGVAGLLFGIVALIICVVSVGQVNISYTLMMGFFGLFFTVYTPIGMKLKVKQQMKTVAAFKEPVRYTVTEEKILLQQGAVTEEMLWEDIFKIKCTGKSLVLYITSVRANIIPLRDIGDELDAFLTIAEKKLKRVCLTGHQMSIPYIDRARILCLTSVIEGLPTVFTEAMSLGVIPIGFDSFNAIYDMIDDGIDGFIIPDNNYEQYAETILRLAQDDTLRCRIAYKAQKRKNRYDIEQVGPLWMETFRKHGLIK